MLFDHAPDDTPDHVSLRRDRRAWRRAFAISATFVLLLGWIQLVEHWVGRDLTALGLYPREWSGLIGVLCAPLLHGGLEHLAANSLALLILGTLALYAYPKATPPAIAWIWVASGIGTWLIGRESVHIGASGLTHGLMFYLFTLGLLRWDRRAIAVALVTFLFYGGMLLTVLPREAGVSWEYHLTGAVAGVIAAIVLRRRDPLPPRRKWSWEIEEEQARAAAEREAAERAQWELPRPQDVPVLWDGPRARRDDETRGQVLPFRPRSPGPSGIDDEPPTPTRH